MRLRFLPEAESDLEQAAEYYLSEADARIAAEFCQEVRRVAHLVLDRPGIGHRVGRDARAFTLTRFPCDLIYRITREDVVVVAIAHHRRRPGHWRGRH